MIKLFLQVLLLGFLAFILSTIWESLTDWKMTSMPHYDILTNFSSGSLFVGDIGADTIKVRAAHPFNDS